MTKATAAVLLETEEPLALQDVELDDPGPGRSSSRSRGVGICHTDVAAIEGVVPFPLPAVLGHEGSGVVEKVGEDVSGLAVGDHVALSFDHCGECDLCLRGLPAYCEVFAALNYFGTRIDGSVTMSRGDDDVHGNWFGQSSFSSYAIASQHNAVKVDKDLPIELLGPLGCGFQTGAGSVLNVLKPSAGEGFCAFGAGSVGLFAVMAAAACGCDPIIAVDLNDQRLALARELGATHTFNPSKHHDLIWDMQLVVAPGVHYSFDAVGTAPVVKQAIEVLRSPGHCVSVGFQGLEHPVEIDQGFLLLGRKLEGVIEGNADPQRFIPQMLELHRQGRFPFEKLIKTFRFDQINEAMEAANDGAVIKPVLVFD